MKRTKQPENNTRFMYPVDEEPIVLSKPLLDTFLSRPNPGDLIALYCFYYYTAKWQKTNQPKATVAYTAKGIKLGVNKIRSLKKQLKELGLIQDIVTRGEGNRVTGHYIKVNFIWKSDEFHPNEFPKGGNRHTVEKNEGNALSSIKENALSSIKERIFEFLPRGWDKNETFQGSLQSYLVHRKEKRQMLTNEACKRLGMKLAKYPVGIATTALLDSVSNGWTGVFPESVKQPVDGGEPIPTPLEIIQDFFHEDHLHAKTFHEERFLDVEALLFNRSDETSSALAVSMIELYRWIQEKQTNSGPVPMTPAMLISDYTRWLEKQHWLEVEPRLFLPVNNIFQKKFLPKANEAAGMNVLTGK